MDADQACRLFGGQRVARLATVDAGGAPHLVPVTFALAGDRIVIAVDHKPKSTTDLKRLRNIRANPRVALLADHYDDDWTRLWWVRADGTARVLGPDAATGGEAGGEAVDALVEKYEQYRGRRPAGPVVLVDVTRWSGWRAS
ncbi:TIGR03668 family PPOX class F420-dependent oxidoreductase [Nonomuraea rhodomycinica]|uniref:TIGR03668 family PPOX class F420-dependent oxidoreductase n=1 Tax=Nonomuraea rhodomycinica TaxID=1712872 RepID=A0A7Y6IVX0_9ACTN|nr:TIGR03668 family PPOX class F420-dependent oxidoreductase [Nonomuraea rhodomycinica]NUW45135.1 TIGR03668 family PPOX class F420-dependent oxidoreductase [Nonomuraea rhodomycinica]